jgi:hypothetical protein
MSAQQRAYVAYAIHRDNGNAELADYYHRLWLRLRQTTKG